MISRLGVSKSFAWWWQVGRTTAHPSHWAALAEPTGVTCHEGLLDANSGRGLIVTGISGCAHVLRGISNPDRVAELIAAGADAVRVGTAFLACPEARTHPDTSPTFSPPPAMTPR
jgi:hypothetical protein